MGWQAYKTRKIVYKTINDDVLPMPPPIPPFLNAADDEYDSPDEPETVSSRTASKGYEIFEPVTRYSDFDGDIETTRTAVTSPTSTSVTPGGLHSLFDFDSDSKISQLIQDAEDLLVNKLD